ncbi:ATP-binding protein [Terricaulis silvestris]|uniref:histidine kinase n=1 Tax=Terricaulis silvestris TaxID=2686094 RepID=A0A6I6MGX2_9CAUL|nr:ATP-binding protein [Terricaulis silvestris]QGZ94015.1 Osmolarity sensor protein EnvZ [Terricaulis silvestris]
MIDTRNGFPIAVYLGALVALALTAAFVAVMAIVIWLPPRPPDVVRADMVSRHFSRGYEFAQQGRTAQERGVEWRIQAATPSDTYAEPLMVANRMQLAGQLSLRPDQVRFSAQHIEQGDTFVFRVRDVAAIELQAQRAARDLERNRRALERAERMNTQELARHREALERARRAGVRVQVHGDDVVVDTEGLDEEIERAVREVQAFEWDPEDFEADIDEEAIEREVDEAMRNVPPTPHVPHVGPVGPVAAPAPPTPPAPVVATPRVPAPAAVTPPEPPEPAEPEVPVFAPAPPGVALISGFEVSAQLPDGRWLVMHQGRNWAEIGWIGRAMLIIGGTLTILLLLAVLFARRLTSPIRNFSNAVQAVGVNPQSEPVAEEGPRELRGAARAVNTMQARLRALIADRTKTLAAVAHDMRTPLMRLRLQAENVAPEQRERMAKEIEEVEALVAGFIAFARDDPAEEARVRIDLSALLQSITDDRVEARQNVVFEGEERMIITAQSLGLKRLFSNLVDNALKYGASAKITLKREEGQVVIDVEDEGPGVPADQRESVFEPFVRLQEGASGAGLGLPAARSIGRAHGGEIEILDGEKGALLRVTLPG